MDGRSPNASDGKYSGLLKIGTSRFDNSPWHRMSRQRWQQPLKQPGDGGGGDGGGGVGGGGSCTSVRVQLTGETVASPLW